MLAFRQQSRTVNNICDARVTFTDHGFTQYGGGLAQFVLRDSAVEQDGLQQAGVVQVDVVVPLLRVPNTHTHLQTSQPQLQSKLRALLYNERLE